MSKLQLITSGNGASSSDKVELIELPRNYSILINKLERLAWGLDSDFGNFTLDRKELDVAVSSGSNELTDTFGGSLLAGHVPSSSHSGIMRPHLEAEIPVVVSDIWIGVILTLLIVSVIFFICSCFVYHKFQQWKNSYRTNPEPVELCRHFPPDYEAESLPSYTIVSGLPTYDAALEEFRKASIILTPPIPMVKIFEKDALNPNNTPIKDNHVFNIENELNPNNNDNISVTSTSTCTCGAANANVTNSTNTNSNALLTTSSPPQNMLTSQVIELSPEQLAALSRKRLSLQISFNNGLQRNSRRAIDLYRQVNRNNMLRSQAVAAAAAAIAATAAANAATAANDSLPRIHRSSSSLSLSNEPQMLDQRLVQHLQHRGSLY